MKRIKYDVQIKKKTLQTIAVSVLMYSVDTPYDMKNRYDRIVLRMLAKKYSVDGFLVLLDVPKYVAMMEEELETVDEYQHVLETYELDRDKRDLELRHRKLSEKEYPSDLPAAETLDDKFNRSYVLKHHEDKK